MTTPAMKILTTLFQYNHGLIHEQLKDITHSESLLQPPFPGNCMNWVIGHILWGRDTCLKLAGLPGYMTEDENEVYGFGSIALTDPARSSDLYVLVERLDVSLNALTEQLAELSREELDRKIQTWRGLVSLCETLYIMQSHESYHAGQLELLRQLAGKV